MDFPPRTTETRSAGLLARGLALAVVLGAATAFGEGHSTFVPTLGAAESYDDNLFASPSARQTDWISRFTAGLEWGYRSTPIMLVVRYSRDAEVFHEHPALDTTRGREGLDLDVRYQPRPTLLLTLFGAGLDTHAPEELTTATGLDLGRLRVRRLSSGASVSEAFDPLLKGSLGYSFVREEIVGGLVGDTHEGRLAVDRRLDARGALSFGYTARFYVVGAATTPAHILSLGFKRDLDSHTHLTVSGGPRYSQGAVGPEVEASLARDIRGGQVSLALARSERPVLGEAHPVGTASATATLAAEPLHALKLSVAPGASWNSQGPFRATVYHVITDLACHATPWLTISASHQFNLQEGSLGPVLGGRIPRNVVLLRVVASPSIR